MRSMRSSCHRSDRTYSTVHEVVDSKFSAGWNINAYRCSHARIYLTPKPVWGSVHYITCLMIFKKWRWPICLDFTAEERMSLCCWLGVITWMLDIIALINVLRSINVIHTLVKMSNILLLVLTLQIRYGCLKHNGILWKLFKPNVIALVSHIRTYTQISPATTSWLVMLHWIRSGTF